MTKRTFTRGQTQILYRFLPEAIFAHDDYGLCKVTEVTIEDGGAIKDRKSTRLNSSHIPLSRMPSSA